MSSGDKATGLDSNAIYYEVSPTIICVLRLYNLVTLLMVVIAFILCLVKGHENSTHYLLACNLVLSGFISIVINWWYRQGGLSSDKYWYVFLLASIIIFQAITTDVFVFHVVPVPGGGGAKTLAPIPWHTINASTLAVPTTHSTTLFLQLMTTLSTNQP